MQKETIREVFPLVNSCTYLNTAANGLISKSIAKAGQESFQDLLNDGSMYSDFFLKEKIVELRRRACQMFDCNDQDLGIIPSFSHGLNLILRGIPRKCKVVILGEDYPSLTIPLERGDFETVSVQAKHNGFYDIDEIEQCIEEHKPDLFICSHVQYNTGQLLPIERLAAFVKRLGTSIIIDATQSAGAIPISLKNSLVDGFVFSNYKWLNSGFGSGLMLIKNSFFEKYPPKTGGYGSIEWENGEMRIKQGIRQLEPAHLSKAPLSALNEAIKLHLELGQESIYKHNKELLAKFLDATKGKLDILGSGNIDDYGCFCCIQDKNSKISIKLGGKNIIHTNRHNVVRIGFHFYNNEKDLNTVLNAILS